MQTLHGRLGALKMKLCLSLAACAALLCLAGTARANAFVGVAFETNPPSGYAVTYYECDFSVPGIYMPPDGQTVAYWCGISGSNTGYSYLTQAVLAWNANTVDTYGAPAGWSVLGELAGSGSSFSGAGVAVNPGDAIHLLVWQSARDVTHPLYGPTDTFTLQIYDDRISKTVPIVNWQTSIPYDPNRFQVAKGAEETVTPQPLANCNDAPDVEMQSYLYYGPTTGNPIVYNPATPNYGSPLLFQPLSAACNYGGSYASGGMMFFDNDLVHGGH